MSSLPTSSNGILAQFGRSLNKEHQPPQTVATATPNVSLGHNSRPDVKTTFTAVESIHASLPSTMPRPSPPSQPLQPHEHQRQARPPTAAVRAQQQRRRSSATPKTPTTPSTLMSSRKATARTVSNSHRPSSASLTTAAANGLAGSMLRKSVRKSVVAAAAPVEPPPTCARPRIREWMIRGEEPKTRPTTPERMEGSSSQKQRHAVVILMKSPAQKRAEERERLRLAKERACHLALERTHGKYVRQACNKIGVWFRAVKARRALRQRRTMYRLECILMRDRVKQALRKYARRRRVLKNVAENSFNHLTKCRRAAAAMRMWRCYQMFRRDWRPDAIEAIRASRERVLSAEKTRYAATLIQRWVRCALLQHWYQKRLRPFRHGVCARRLQRWWRHVLYVRSARERVNQQCGQSNVAAEDLQRVFRGFVGRQHFADVRLESRTGHTKPENVKIM